MGRVSDRLSSEADTGLHTDPSICCRTHIRSMEPKGDQAPLQLQRIRPSCCRYEHCLRYDGVVLSASYHQKSAYAYAAQSLLGMGSDSGLVMDRKRNGYWQKLERSDVGDTGNHSVDIEGGLQTNSEHLETTHEGVTPMKIAVTRGFGTGDSEAC